MKQPGEKKVTVYISEDGARALREHIGIVPMVRWKEDSEFTVPVEIIVPPPVKKPPTLVEAARNVIRLYYAGTIINQSGSLSTDPTYRESDGHALLDLEFAINRFERGQDGR